jgi:filamentous hemagglutinin family protein
MPWAYKFITINFVTGLLLTFFPYAQFRVEAQVIPDNSLGVNRSIVEGNGEVFGGSRQGSSLFHSFERFDVPLNGSAYFVNPVGVENIFTRVTGGLPSNINGALGVTGPANLYFINPSGIVFGNGSSLDLRGGSLFVSTANSISFANNTGSYSAVNPQAPLLTMQVPVGLQIGNQPKSIQINDTVLSLGNNLPEAQRNFVIVGGDVAIKNSIVQLLAYKGNLEIAGLTETGTVQLGSNGQILTLPANSNRANISVLNNSNSNTFVDNYGSIAGDIRIQARNLEVVNSVNQSRSTVINRSIGTSQSSTGGAIIIDATENVLVSGPRAEIAPVSPATSKVNGGDVNINARNLYISEGGSIVVVPQPGSGYNGGNIFIRVLEKVLVDAPQTSRESGIYTGTLGSGNAGEMNIWTRQLIVRNGGQLSADNSSSRPLEFANGTGNAGKININAIDYVEVNGLGLTKPSAISSFTETTGNAGDINIETSRLFVRNGGSITAGTDGLGKAGSLFISGIDKSRADLVELSGSSPNLNGSRIRTITTTDSNAGSISIKTRELSIQGGTRIDTRNAIVNSNVPGGSAGNITIEADVVNAMDGGQIISTTSGTGRGGIIKVTADSAITLSGSDPLFANRPVDPIQRNASAYSGFVSLAESNSPGQGGDIVVNAAQLNVLDNGRITVDSAGTGNGGNIDVRADRITLDRGQVIAETASANGGNIFLSPQSLMVLRDQSKISATAALRGDGGNVSIKSGNGLVIAVPTGNSDITANAEGGRGGRVEIGVLNVFGFSNAVNFPELSNITATSAQGTQGVVTINTPGTDPNQGLEALPIEPRSPQFSDSCRPGSTQVTNSLVNSSQGGIPLNPGDTLLASATWSDSRYRSENPIAKTNNPEVLAAQGWKRESNRTVVLTIDSNGQQGASNQIAAQVKRSCYGR